MKVQDAIEAMSERKRFHVIVFTLLALNFMFIPIHIFVDLFLSYEPKHYCAYPHGGSKYQWIPYNHETHAFYSCAIYEEPLTKELEKAEKKRIEEESYHKDVKVWDWKALKFKRKHYHKSHDDQHVADHADHAELKDHKGSGAPGEKGRGIASGDHRRRRREQPRPPQTDTPSSGATHRFVTEDGRILEADEVAGALSGVTDAPSAVTSVTPDATSASPDVTGAPPEVTSVPFDVTDASSDVVGVSDTTESAPSEGEGTTAADVASAGDVAPSEAGRPDAVLPTDLTPSDVAPDTAEADGHDPHQQLAEVGAEDHTDLVVEETTEHGDAEEEVIVHRFDGKNGGRELIGAGTTTFIVPEHEEYQVSDEVTDGATDEHSADAEDGADEGDEGDEAGDDDDPSPDVEPDHEDEGLHTGHDAAHGDARAGGAGDGADGHAAGDRSHSHNRDPGGDGASGDAHSDLHGDPHGEGDGEEDAGVKVAASTDREVTSDDQHGHGGVTGHRTIPCQHGIHYLADVGTTLITEYGLSCKPVDISVITNTVLGTAMVAGAIIFAPFVDKYGRKTLFMMVCCQNCLISLGIAFVGDIRSYWVLRFLSRFYIEGVEIALLVLAVEMAPSKSRPIAPLILYVAYAIGQILLSLQAMLFRSWWKLQLAISVESILLIPFSWFLMPESIQWLVSMRRHQEAEKLIRLGCRLNGIILPSDFKLDKVDHDDGDGSDDEAAGNGHAHNKQPRKSAVERLRSTQLNLKNRPGTGEYLQHEFHAHIGEWRKILNLMKNHQLRRHFFIVSYMWAIVGFLYYGLTASTMVMKGNVYLNYCLSGLVMIPASVSIFILRRFGRKKPIFYFLIGAGIFIILSVTCPYKTPDGVDMYPVYLAIKLMAKYCVVSCLISIRLLIIELFPTPVRGTLIGLTALIGLLGSALGYYFTELITFSKWVGVVVGGLTILAAILSRMLPETSHRPLPDTINDMMAACREMFLNLLVAMPNMPRPEPQVATPQPRPKRNMSALSAFSAVLSWRSRSKTAGGGGGGEAPVRSMSDEDFKRPPHPPLSSIASSPLPCAEGQPSGERPAPALRSLVQRARAAEQPARPSLRERMSRALSQRRADNGAQLEVAQPRMARRSSSTSSLATAGQRQGFDNPQYEQETPKVSFDLVRADSRDLAPAGPVGGRQDDEGDAATGGEPSPPATVQATTQF